MLHKTTTSSPLRFSSELTVRAFTLEVTLATFLSLGSPLSPSTPYLHVITACLFVFLALQVAHIYLHSLPCLYSRLVSTALCCLDLNLHCTPLHCWQEAFVTLSDDDFDQNMDAIEAFLALDDVDSVGTYATPLDTMFASYTFYLIYLFCCTAVHCIVLLREGH